MSCTCKELVLLVITAAGLRNDTACDIEVIFLSSLQRDCETTLLAL